MTFTITKGMDGKRVQTLGKYSSDNINQMFMDFINWKNTADKNKYYIASYERHLINNNEHKVIIDFGDYSYFGLIKANKKEWPALMSHKIKPTNLEI